jgi:5-methylcytosine-specific restriction protein A
MALAYITKDAVLAAIVEYEALGADTFLSQYGFAPAKRYWLEWNGKRYPSKAIAGVAHRHIYGNQLLPSASFTGGEASVVKRLRQLGFVIDTPDRNLSRPIYRPFPAGYDRTEALKRNRTGPASADTQSVSVGIIK